VKQELDQCSQAAFPQQPASVTWFHLVVREMLCLECSGTGDAAGLCSIDCRIGAQVHAVQFTPLCDYPSGKQPLQCPGEAM
jgi:hypothetical protein